MRPPNPAAQAGQAACGAARSSTWVSRRRVCAGLGAYGRTTGSDALLESCQQRRHVLHRPFPAFTVAVLRNLCHGSIVVLERLKPQLRLEFAQRRKNSVVLVSYTHCFDKAHRTRPGSFLVELFLGSGVPAAPYFSLSTRHSEDCKRRASRWRPGARPPARAVAAVATAAAITAGGITGPRRLCAWCGLGLSSPPVSSATRCNVGGNRSGACAV
jgi:hypothetical protein